MAATGFHSADELNALLPGTLPGLLGLVVTSHEPGRLEAALDVRPDLLAPNGYLHAATVVALADTACGLATRALLPEGAAGCRPRPALSPTGHLSGTLRPPLPAATAGVTLQPWPPPGSTPPTSSTPCSPARCRACSAW